MLRPITCLLLLLVPVIENSTIAQSLSIRLNSANRLSLEATAPANTGYRIQSSTNHTDWQDISDQASGLFSYWVDPTPDHQFFRLRTWPTEDAPVTVIMVGDSTMADFAANLETFSGWGQGMHDEFKPNVRFINFAKPVYSSKMFLISVERQNLELIKPEFVVVQFGLVDVYPLDIQTTLPEYEANLRTIVQLIRNFNGTPILVTPTPLRVFDSTGRVKPFLPDRCEVVRKVASELQTYFVDLNTLLSDLYNELGPTNSAHITWPGDESHFSLAGAEIISDLFVEALPDILKSQAVSP